MKSYLKRLSAGFLVLAMLMSSGSMNILASNVSIGNGTTADVEEQVANENNEGNDATENQTVNENGGGIRFRECWK